jgi:hypothetical protein
MPHGDRLFCDLPALHAAVLVIWYRIQIRPSLITFPLVVENCSRLDSNLPYLGDIQFQDIRYSLPNRNTSDSPLKEKLYMKIGSSLKIGTAILISAMWFGSSKAAYIDDLEVYATANSITATNSGVVNTNLAMNSFEQLSAKDDTIGAVDLTSLNDVGVVGAAYNFAEIFPVTALSDFLTISAATVLNCPPVFVGTSVVVALLDSAGKWIDGKTVTPGGIQENLNLLVSAGDMFQVALIGIVDASHITDRSNLYSMTVASTAAVPVPAAVWLFGTAMMGLLGLRRKSRMAVAA